MKRSIVSLLLFVACSLGATPVFAAFDADYERALQKYYDGRYEETITVLKQYVNTKPEPAAYYLIGYSLYKMGRHGEATQYFDQAYLIDPNFSPEKSGLKDQFPKGRPSAAKVKEHRSKKAAKPTAHKKAKEQPKEAAAVASSDAESPEMRLAKAEIARKQGISPAKEQKDTKAQKSPAKGPAAPKAAVAAKAAAPKAEPKPQPAQKPAPKAEASKPAQPVSPAAAQKTPASAAPKAAATAAQKAAPQPQPAKAAPQAAPQAQAAAKAAPQPAPQAPAAAPAAVNAPKPDPAPAAAVPATKPVAAKATVTKPGTSSMLSDPMMIGGIAAAVAVVLLGISLIFFMRKRKRQQSYPEPSSGPEADPDSKMFD